MKILIISCVFPPEPLVSANLSYDLALALSEKHQVKVLRPTATRPMGYDYSGATCKEYPFKHQTLKSYTHPKSTFIGRFRESFSYGKACAKYINTNYGEIDLVYMNTWPLFGQFLAIRAAKKWNIPIVLHIQDIYPEAFSQKLPVFVRSWVNTILFPLERFITAYSSKIVTISQEMSNLLLITRKLPLSKVEVVYNWQDETKFFIDENNAASLPEKPITHFMFLGSLGPVANVDNLIQGFALRDEKSLKLTIAGEGSEKSKLQKFAMGLNESRIHFINAPASDVYNIQAAADVLLLSLKKGAAGLALPSKLSAYMFSAKPIIATVDHDSETANVIRDSGCGWVVEPQNPDALAELIHEITLKHKVDLIQMGLCGRTYALQHFSKQRNLLKLASIVEETIKI